MPDPATDANGGGWMGDVQRAIALILVGTFALITTALSIRLVIKGDMPTLLDLGKTLQSSLVNMALIALGFFFGSNQSKLLADAGQQKTIDKLTSAPPGTLPPTPAPAAPAAWWPKLTDAEKTAIADRAASDPQVGAFVASASTGTATPDQLAHLVAVGLLTPDRAAAVSAP